MAVDAAAVELWEHLDDRSVRLLLTDGDPRRADEIVAEYRRDRARRCLLGLVRGRDLVGVVGACTPYAGVCEILHLVVAPTSRRAGLGTSLVQLAADRVHAVAIRADVHAGLAPFWEAAGFAVRPLGDRAGLLRAERRNPPEPEGHRTTADIRVAGARRFVVDLPPEGNTLPLIPDALHGLAVPAHVAAWVLEAEEVGLLLQELAPQLFPPVTPARRPESVRAALGPIAPVVGADATVDAMAPSDHLPGLPVGLEVPVRVVELLAAAERIRSWLLAGRRVRAWAEANGHGDAVWLVHDAWEPPDLA